MEEIFYNNTLMGIKITSIPEGSLPATTSQTPLQVVTLKHPKGTHLVAHKHRPVKKITNFSETCFVVRKGKVKINIYEPENHKLFKSITLKNGEVFITLNGSGHGLIILEDCELFEIKNGPFVDDKIII